MMFELSEWFKQFGKDEVDEPYTSDDFRDFESFNAFMAMLEESDSESDDSSEDSS